METSRPEALALVEPVSPGFNIRFPDGEAELGQDEEWFEFEHEGRLQRLRIHDYSHLYCVPGLYEALVYDRLACASPGRLTTLLEAVLTDWRVNPKDLRVLDLGAGNGAVASELRKLGVSHLFGLDLLPEAKMAAQRDRPGLYKDYLVADLRSLSATEEMLIACHTLNCLVTVAALGFGDIPPKAFGVAFNAISSDGWLAMTIKETFLATKDSSGFSRLINVMLEERIIEPQATQRYCHRLSTNGKKINYVALIAKKTRHIPSELLEDELSRQDS